MQKGVMLSDIAYAQSLIGKDVKYYVDQDWRKIRVVDFDLVILDHAPALMIYYKKYDRNNFLAEWIESDVCDISEIRYDNE